MSDVDYADVVAFCANQPPEGLGLDYKQDLSSMTGVVKTLVSFANTNGGWLVVGVEDEDDKPKLPVTGMAFSTDLEQRITNAIVSSVSPIVVPYTKVCKSPDGKHAFVIAFMPQSQSAPHMMVYKKKNLLFIRVADRATSEDWEGTATGSQWEQLRNRRQASVELRDQLVNSMKEVFEARVDLDKSSKDEEEAEIANSAGFYIPAARAPFLPTTGFFEGEEYEKAQTISILPSYPTVKVADIDKIDHFMHYEPFRNGIHRYRAQTPDLRGYDTKIYQFGITAFHQEERSGGYYFFGQDLFGNMMTVDPIEFSQKGNPNGSPEHFLSLDIMLMQIVGTLNYAKNVYANIGLLGNLIFRVEFTGSKNALMFPETTGLVFNTNNLPTNLTGNYLVQREIDTNVLNDDESRHAFVMDVVKEILNSFNFHVPKEQEAVLLKLIAHAEGVRE